MNLAEFRDADPDRADRRKYDEGMIHDILLYAFVYHVNVSRASGRLPTFQRGVTSTAVRAFSACIHVGHIHVGHKFLT